jgi:hypothetical protein
MEKRFATNNRMHSTTGRDGEKVSESLTFGRVLSALLAFAATKALTTLLSFFGAPLRNSFRMLSSDKTSLNLRDRLSMACRSAAVGAASGCHSPPPVESCGQHFGSSVCCQASTATPNSIHDHMNVERHERRCRISEHSAAPPE